jgi:hypothetical protein
MQLGTFWVACALCGLISPDVTENDRHGQGHTSQTGMQYGMLVA